MKKIFIFCTILLLTACCNLYPYGTCEEKHEGISNPECDITPEGIYISQVLDKGVLGKPLYYYRPGYKTIDKTRFNKPDSSTPIIYISASKEILANKYDDMYLEFDENSCLKSDGTYSYATAIGSKKTVQKFKIIQPRYIPNSEYPEE